MNLFCVLLFLFLSSFFLSFFSILGLMGGRNTKEKLFLNNKDLKTPKGTSLIPKYPDFNRILLSHLWVEGNPFLFRYDMCLQEHFKFQFLSIGKITPLLRSWMDSCKKSRFTYSEKFWITALRAFYTVQMEYYRRSRKIFHKGKAPKTNFVEIHKNNSINCPNSTSW